MLATCVIFMISEYLNGWACFVVSIAMIGLFTAVIGDLANHFGCSIGLKDAVTAISFVAMGTSVPGMQNFFCISENHQKKFKNKFFQIHLQVKSQPFKINTPTVVSVM